MYELPVFLGEHYILLNSTYAMKGGQCFSTVQCNRDQCKFDVQCKIWPFPHCLLVLKQFVKYENIC